MEGHDDLVEALTPLVDLLDRLGVAWYVGGSVASTVHGHFRATNDVDVVADLREEHAALSLRRGRCPGIPRCRARSTTRPSQSDPPHVIDRIRTVRASSRTSNAITPFPALGMARSPGAISSLLVLR